MTPLLSGSLVINTSKGILNKIEWGMIISFFLDLMLSSIGFISKL